MQAKVVMRDDIGTMTERARASLPLGVMVELKQIGIVTRDMRKTISAMLKAGIGPWTTFTFDANTTSEQTYHGKPAKHVFKIALAQISSLMWEIIEPVEGENIYTDFLDSHGEGYHHLLYDGEGMSYQEKVSALETAGFLCIQSGRWMGGVTYAYFERNPEHGVIIEIVDRQPGWQRPTPDETFA